MYNIHCLQWITERITLLDHISHYAVTKHVDNKKKLSILAWWHDPDIMLSSISKIYTILLFCMHDKMLYIIN